MKMAKSKKSDMFLNVCPEPNVLCCPEPNAFHHFFEIIKNVSLKIENGKNENLIFVFDISAFFHLLSTPSGTARNP